MMGLYLKLKRIDMTDVKEEPNEKSFYRAGKSGY